MSPFFPKSHAAIACLAVLWPAWAPAAEDAEVAALRAEIAAMKAEYTDRVSALEQRLELLESAQHAVAEVAPATEPPASEPAPTPAASGSRGSAFNPAISAILNGTYADLSRDPDDYAIAGFIPAGDEVGPGEGGFSLGESELTLSANVDPYFFANLTAAFTGDEVEVEEAFFRTTALPSGFTLKGGRFFSGLGYLSEIHAHAWDFADAPLAYQAMFGGGNYVQDGLQLKWLAPTDLFVEFGAEVGNGEAFPATRASGDGVGNYALFAHVGGDVGESIGWRAGVSWIDADATDRRYDDVDGAGNAVTNAFDGDSQTWVVDATLKWSPGGDARRRSLELQGEYFRREEDGTLAFDVDGAARRDSYRTRQDAWYVQGVYRFAPRWRAGLRYDGLDSGDPSIGIVRNGTLSAADFPLLQPATPSRVSVMVDWSASEFSRLRAQYAWDDARDHAGTDEQWLLQYIYAIGAHGAHKF